MMIIVESPAHCRLPPDELVLGRWKEEQHPIGTEDSHHGQAFSLFPCHASPVADELILFDGERSSGRRVPAVQARAAFDGPGGAGSICPLFRGCRF